MRYDLGRNGGVRMVDGWSAVRRAGGYGGRMQTILLVITERG